MSVLVTTRPNGLPGGTDAAGHPAAPPFPATNGRLIRLPVAPAAAAQHLLVVEFRSPDGRSWNAIGGGDTVAEAIIWARESCPDDANWDAVSWDDLYGD